VPLFYDRGLDGIPRGWVATMKASLQSLCPVFSTDRMVQEYTEHCYLPSYLQWQQLAQAELAPAIDLANWKESMQKLWPQVRIDEVEAKEVAEVVLGTKIPISAKVFIGDIPLTDLAVDAYFGVLDSRGNIVGGELLPLEITAELGKGVHLYSGEIECRFCGRHGFMVRVMPRHHQFGPVYEPGLLLWG
jgi:starch phosphorylase